MAVTKTYRYFVSFAKLSLGNDNMNWHNAEVTLANKIESMQDIRLLEAYLGESAKGLYKVMSYQLMKVVVQNANQSE